MLNEQTETNVGPSDIDIVYEPAFTVIGSPAYQLIRPISLNTLVSRGIATTMRSTFGGRLSHPLRQATERHSCNGSMCQRSFTVGQTRCVTSAECHQNVEHVGVMRCGQRCLPRR
jgi:hypothetical protein